LEKSNKEVVNCEDFQFGGIGKKNSIYNMPPPADKLEVLEILLPLCLYQLR
jgi:hypothetical protein